MRSPLICLCILCLYVTPTFARPLIIAHAGGKADWPENTLFAFQHAEQIGVDGIELDVQLTADGVPVVFHGPDLSRTTNGNGSIADHSLAYLKTLNAGWWFKVGKEYPFRDRGLRIPTLKEAISSIRRAFIVIDFKSLPAKPLVEAVIRSIPDDQWSKLVFYSTNPSHLKLLKVGRPDAVMFEDRNTTRFRLLAFTNEHACMRSSNATWLGFELVRTMDVIETLTLGNEQTQLAFQLWNPESIACTREKAPQANVVLFGINSLEAYQKAKKLQVDAVYTDSPTLLLDKGF